MPFVKLDCGILNSTLWFTRDAREVFLTALLMAEPFELKDPEPQLQIHSLEPTGWSVPPGWYGFVPAAGIGIIHRARVDETAGYAALETLSTPEASSRSQDFDGRRLVRVDGGYIVLNYMKYRERDYTTAERSRRYRARKAEQESRRDVTAPHRDITQAEVEVEVEVDRERSRSNPLRASRSVKVLPAAFLEFWTLYPRKVGKGAALKAWTKLKPNIGAIRSAIHWQINQPTWTKDAGQFIPHPATWLNRRGWEDEPFHAPAEPISQNPRGKGHQTIAAVQRAVEQIERENQGKLR